jgi:hypothetical protein
MQHKCENECLLLTNANMNMKWTWQGYGVRSFLILLLNKLKIMGNFTFIYTPWAFSSKKFLKKLQSTCDSCLPMCVNVHPCVNYGWINIQLKEHKHGKVEN